MKTWRDLAADEKYGSDNTRIPAPRPEKVAEHWNELRNENEPTMFRDLAVGDSFDFVGPNWKYNSFYRRCVKVSARKYRDDDGREHEVGTIDCNVYHVDKMP